MDIITSSLDFGALLYSSSIVSVKIIMLIVCLLITTAYLTFAERKVIAYMQLRLGPSIAGPFGLLQPIADAIKLVFKEPIIPVKADKKLFIIAPIITFVFSLVGWAVIPIDHNIVLSRIHIGGILFILAVTSLGVYGIIIAGWASNSKYSFLGSIRSAAQMISYELSMALSIIAVLIVTGEMDLIQIVEAQKTRPLWLTVMMLPLAVVYFISILAKTNRLPFDIPEAESELVAGYNVEYSSMAFAMFFLGEYANMILGSSLMTIMFLGGYLPPFNLAILTFIPGYVWFILKVAMVLFCFLWIRATLPRYRYDQLMYLGLKVFLPFVLAWIIVVSTILVYNNN
nr:NADH-quinone oxidoreductase subunit NuoH [Candidatus Orientia mediorientalis]